MMSASAMQGGHKQLKISTG